MTQSTHALTPPPPPSLPVRIARKALNAEPVRRLQEHPFFVRAKQDDRHIHVLALGALGPDDVAVDVGAHRGDFLDIVLPLAPGARHVAFEPLPAKAAGLRARYPGVDVREAALSDAEGEITFLHVEEDPGYSGFRRGTYAGDYTPKELTVRRARLDDELGTDAQVAMIKIDVEGAELEVLRGARALLARCRPVVVFEHFKGHADAYGTTAGDLHALLTEVGLRLFDIDGAGPLSADEMQSAADAAAVWNFVARP